MNLPSMLARGGRVALTVTSSQQSRATIGFMTSTTDFETAAHSFLDLVAEVKVSQWSEPALGVWDVRSLVGHTARAILTVEQYLSADPAPEITTPDAESYYSEIFGAYTDNDAIAARGVEAGKNLTADSGAEFEATLNRALKLIVDRGPDRCASTCARASSSS
jgi:hypothetical protein